MFERTGSDYQENRRHQIIKNAKITESELTSKGQSITQVKNFQLFGIKSYVKQNFVDEIRRHITLAKDTNN